MSIRSGDGFLKPGDIEMRARSGSKAEMTEIDEFDETNPLNPVDESVRSVIISPTNALRDNSDEERSLRLVDDDEFDELDGFAAVNGNGKIPKGTFPQWPKSYPPDEVLIEHSPNLNVYQQKKSMAQGLLDLALLSANANQLRYVLDMREHTNYFYISIALILISLVFQVLVAFALVFKARYNVDNEAEYLNANRINNFIMVGVLLITIANVLSSAFAPATTSR